MTRINGRWDLEVPYPDRIDWSMWERHRLAAFREACFPGAVVIDVGATEGLFGALAASWKCLTILVEPSEEAWPAIRWTYEHNHLPHPRAMFQGFATDHTDRWAYVQLLGWPDCSEGEMGTIAFRNVKERAHDTPQIRLDDLVACANVKPDVITIDVEGAELAVLAGARETLRTLSPVVFCSIHDEMMRRDWGYPSARLHRFMKRVGYRGEFLDVDHEEHWRFTK